MKSLRCRMVSALMLLTAAYGCGETPSTPSPSTLTTTTQTVSGTLGTAILDNAGNHLPPVGGPRMLTFPINMTRAGTVYLSIVSVSPTGGFQDFELKFVEAPGGNCGSTPARDVTGSSFSVGVGGPPTIPGLVQLGIAIDPPKPICAWVAGLALSVPTTVWMTITVNQ